ncbi:MAG: tRNA lysidine(34) synthetase TilS [Actinomycetia bacterium]|nr:tRNA lysidine(34) synthetase TilS [Actinomycetes bacterium]
MGPHPAVARARACVRGSLTDLEPGDLVLAACSGGADSLALAAALAHEAPRRGLRGGGVTVDHGLQEGSAAQADKVTGVLGALGLDPVRQVRVTVDRFPGAGGPEAAARRARYAALEQVAQQTGAAAVLLGHTRDDQAETVLLGLARGSGARALAGMPARRGRFRRPMLGLSRSALREACLAQRLEPWDDPHNSDPSYARVRVRRHALPALEEALGPGITEALARSAAQLSADCEALDAIARGEEWRIQPCAPAAHAGDGAVAAVLSVADIDGLAALAPAIRTRVLRQAALLAGCPGGSLSAAHVAALDALVTGWHGQRGADLPGAIGVQRRYGRLLFSAGRLVRGGPVTAGPPERTEAEATGGRE